jgi:hypothetical protein
MGHNVPHIASTNTFNHLETYQSLHNIHYKTLIDYQKKKQQEI